MMQGYFLHCPGERAVFEMFFRRQPFDGGYAVFAGTGPLLDDLEGLRFTERDVAFLRERKIFRAEFLDFLTGFSFRGDVFAAREGSVVFPNEPLVRVHGSLMEVQLIESLLLNRVNFQTLAATKTARVVDASGGLPVMEFGLRRAQGPDGAFSASRAAFIGGAASTSNTLAGERLGIPVSGTMAHSWVMGFDSELESFEKYAEIYPGNCVLLVDTYDTLASGVPNAITVFRKLRERGAPPMAVRIDSGDLEYLSVKARTMLDDAGLPEVKIFVSSDMDEWIMEHLRNSGAPIDAWGVGTRMVTGWGEPALAGVYKIVAKDGGSGFEPCIKISNQPEKVTNPGIKSVLRFFGADGQMLADLLCLEEEADDILASTEKRLPVRFNHPSAEYAGFVMEEYGFAERLLVPVMSGGRKTGTPPALADIREFRRQQVEALDATYRRLINPHVYRTSLTDRLKKLKSDMIRALR
ncbi:MAG: nicotinate phosphoribosyltransferase [Spirochaetes bacterium]|nr:nicotinate phosphoribosyltransferase [Spirochaetota bacterium]